MNELVSYRAGYWMVRAVRMGPEVCARIWHCWHEPGEPGNRMDRAHWQGQIGLDPTAPARIWEMVEFAEASPEEQQLLIVPPLSDRLPRNGRAAAFQTAPLAKWKCERARRISRQQYEAELRWLAWAQTNAPTHPDFTWRKPVNKGLAPIPRFA